MEDYESQVKLFKALMNPARLAILDTLRDDEQCVCHLEAVLGLRLAYISQQLMILRESGLVQDRRDGWNIYYRVTKSEVYEILDRAQRMTGINSEALRSVHKSTQNQADCQCPKCHPSVEPITA